MFTDTHLHLFKEYYDNIDEVLIESINNNVNRWINNGSNNETNKEVLEYSSKYEGMYAAIGIHPESVGNYTDSDINFIKDNTCNVIAIGEIGLDYHYTKENKEEQIKLFEKQLQIAEDNNLPVIIHSRDATLDTINTLKKYNVKGTIHSFSGSIETAREYIKMGYLLGINGVVTFKNANLKEVVKEIPLDNIILETDSPYLTPEPFRGKENHPKHIIEIAKYIANLKDITIDELCSITNENIRRIYHI